MTDKPELPDRIRDVISNHERWTFRTIASSPHDDQFIADLAEAIEEEISERMARGESR